MQQAAKFRSASGRKLTTGLAIRSLPEDQAAQPENEHDEQRLHPPERVVVPVPLLPLAEHHFPARHDQGEQPQADVVEIERLAAQLGPLLLEVIRIVDQEVSTPGSRWRPPGD